MGCSDVTLQIAWICENFIAIFTGKPPKLAVYHLVTEKVGSPGETLAAVLAHVLVRLVPVGVHHVLVKTKK